MSTIKGKKREQTEDFSKKIGMVEVDVIAINPTIEEYTEVLGIELKEESKAANYLGESRDGNNYVRVDFWLEATADQQKFKVSFFLEDRNRMNKDETKQQFINDIGVCSWAKDEEGLPAWFAKREFRNANSGEEDFYSFIRSWLGGLDYRDDDTSLELDWKALLKGNLSDLKEQIQGEFSTPFIAMATVSIKEENDEIKEYQGIYNRGFLPGYTMRHFNLTDYSDPAVLGKVQGKPSKGLKIHERFIQNVTGEYGCKDIYSLRPLKEYVSEEHIAASSDTVGGDGVYTNDDATY